MWNWRGNTLLVDRKNGKKWEYRLRRCFFLMILIYQQLVFVAFPTSSSAPPPSVVHLALWYHYSVNIQRAIRMLISVLTRVEVIYNWKTQIYTPMINQTCIKLFEMLNSIPQQSKTDIHNLQQYFILTVIICLPEKKTDPSVIK